MKGYETRVNKENFPYKEITMLYISNKRAPNKCINCIHNFLIASSNGYDYFYVLICRMP